MKMLEVYRNIIVGYICGDVATLNEEEIVEEQDELRADLNSKSAFFKELQKLSSEFYLLCKKSLDNLQREEHVALVELAKDRMIVISKAARELLLFGRIFCGAIDSFEEHVIRPFTRFA